MDDTPADHDAIQQVINKIMIYPLSDFDGKTKTTEWSKLPSAQGPASDGGGETKWVVPDKFFGEFGSVLDQTPPLPAGSLTLYAGATSPGEEHESNWLPASPGPFSLYIRAYWGKQPILDGSWQPPAVTAV